MRRAAAVLVAALPGLVGVCLATLLELGDRSSCPVQTGPLRSYIGCVIGPTYGLLHPGSPGFNHVFGALVFLAVAVLPTAFSVSLAFRLRRRWASL